MRHIALPAAALLLAACAGNPGPGEPGYAYNLSGDYRAEVVVAGGTYAGGVELQTLPGGGVQGVLLVEEPEVVHAEISGRLAGDTLHYDMKYEVFSSGCTGRGEGTGNVAVGGTEVSGPLTIRDDCAAGEVLEGSFLFRR